MLGAWCVQASVLCAGRSRLSLVLSSAPGSKTPTLSGLARITLHLYFVYEKNESSRKRSTFYFFFPVTGLCSGHPPQEVHKSAALIGHGSTVPYTSPQALRLTDLLPVHMLVLVVCWKMISPFLGVPNTCRPIHPLDSRSVNYVHIRANENDNCTGLEEQQHKPTRQQRRA